MLLHSDYSSYTPAISEISGQGCSPAPSPPSPNQTFSPAYTNTQTALLSSKIFSFHLFHSSLPLQALLHMSPFPLFPLLFPSKLSYIYPKCKLLHYILTLHGSHKQSNNNYTVANLSLGGGRVVLILCDLLHTHTSDANQCSTVACCCRQNQCLPIPSASCDQPA